MDIIISFRMFYILINDVLNTLFMAKEAPEILLSKV